MSVQCSEKRVMYTINKEVPAFYCWDDFNSTLRIIPSLPNGMEFKFNQLTGVPVKGSTWVEYTVQSDRDEFNSFTFVMGGMNFICKRFPVTE